MGRKSKTQLYPPIAALLFILTACSDSDGLSVTAGNTGNTDTTNVESVGNHTAHTNVADGIWPPQPAGIEDVEGYPASARSGAAQSVVESARRSLMNNPDTRAALGDNFRQFDGSLGDNKGDVTASFLFYNYSNNTTVEAHLTREGSIVNNVFPASEWQPPEHADEVIEAIELSQASLVASGYEVAGLEGTAMLAFPQINQIASAERHYYAERVLYVTFGEGDGEVPVYSALVNLSNNTVTDSGMVR